MYYTILYYTITITITILYDTLYYTIINILYDGFNNIISPRVPPRSSARAQASRQWLAFSQSPGAQSSSKKPEAIYIYIYIYIYMHTYMYTYIRDMNKQSKRVAIRRGAGVS